MGIRYVAMGFAQDRDPGCRRSLGGAEEGSGGEWAYNMSRIQLLQMEAATRDVFPGFALALNGESSIATGADPVPGHWIPEKRSKSSSADGEIEVLIGRDTSDAEYWVDLTSGRLCWAPGSVPKGPRSFRMLPQGIWEEVAVG